MAGEPTVNAIIQIGNSDNKLTQREWSDFVADVNRMIDKCHLPKHFVGFSSPDKPWQNACWVIEIDEGGSWIDWLSSDLAILAQQYRQDSIALTVGLTSFLQPTEFKNA